MLSAHWQMKSELRKARSGYALTSNGIHPLHRMLHAPATNIFKHLARCLLPRKTGRVAHG
jgi:hypothetical protein